MKKWLLPVLLCFVLLCGCQDKKTPVLQQVDDTDTYKICHEVLQQHPVGARLRVKFEFRADVPNGEYSTISLYDHRKAFDGAFLGGEWHQVSYDATVRQDAKGKYVELGIHNENDEPYEIRNIAFSMNALPEEMLGGVTLQMLTATNQALTQMQGFLITDGEFVAAIDGGNSGDYQHLYEELLKISPDGHVDAWFITHLHDDHYAALYELLRYGMVTIDTLYYSFPPGGSTFEEGVQFRLEDGMVGEVVKIGEGDCFSYGKMIFKTLNDAYFGSSNYMNDASVVIKLETPGENVLFLGDLGVRGDDYLLNPTFVEEISDCAIVQMAHHGQNGTTQKFYQACSSMKIALYCAPKWLYNNDAGGGIGSGEWNTLHVRQWLRDMDVGIGYYLDGTDLILK